MIEYFAETKARSVIVIGMTVFTTLWSAVFILSGIYGDFVFGLIVGIPVSVLSVYSFYSVVAGGVITISVSSGVLAYKSTSWPQRDFSFPLSKVVAAEIRNDSLRSRFTLDDGSIRKLGWLGYPSDFKNFLETEYPSIKLEYIEGS